MNVCKITPKTLSHNDHNKRISRSATLINQETPSVR